MSKQDDETRLKSILKNGPQSGSKAEKQVKFLLEEGPQEKKEVLRNKYTELKKSVNKKILEKIIVIRQQTESMLKDEQIDYITAQRKKILAEKHRLLPEEFASRLEAVSQLARILQDNREILLENPVNYRLKLIKQADIILEQNYSKELNVYNRMQEINDELKHSYGPWNKGAKPKAPMIPRLPRKNLPSRGI